MNKYIFVLVNTLLYAHTICIDIDKKEPSVIDIKLYKQTFPYAAHFPSEKVAKDVDKNRVFANAFLTRHPKLDANTTHELRLVVENFLASKYIEELKQNNPPTEEALKSFYLDHKELIKPQEKVSIAVIAVDSLSKADKVYLELKKNPEKFEEIAKKESVDPLAKKGGLYENVPLSTFVPEVREWIRNHKEGDISEPIKVGRFYFIDKIVEKKKTDVSYENLKEDIKKILTSAYITNIIEDEYRRLREKEEKR